MKKVIVIFALVLGLGKCFSQPNGGFENWESSFSSESPVSWQTLNFLQFTSPPNPVSAFKVSGLDKHSGNYALKLKSVYLNNNPAPDLLQDTMGVSFTGLINLAPTYYRYGFPYTSRPEKLNFWYKYVPVGADIGAVRVVLTKWNGTKQDTIAYVESTLNQNLSYSLFELPIIYFSDDIPDTAAIFVASSRYEVSARVGSTLYLDDVAFSGWVGVEESTMSKTKVFPNPAKDYISFTDLNKDADALEIIDITGKVIGNYQLERAAVEVSTALWAEGTYIYTVRDKNSNIISKGKFNVAK